nr:hypothetical protein [Tanacetum cinerariifolium]
FKEYYNNSSNGVNAASSSVSTTGQNSIDSTNDFSAAGPSNAAMSILEDLSHDADDVENQSNTHAGFQDTEKAGEEGTQTYVLFPVLSNGSINSQNNNKDAHADGIEHDDDIQKSVSFDIHSSSSGAQTRKQGDKTENKDKEGLDLYVHEKRKGSALAIHFGFVDEKFAAAVNLALKMKGDMIIKIWI